MFIPEVFNAATEKFAVDQNHVEGVVQSLGRRDGWGVATIVVVNESLVRERQMAHEHSVVKDRIRPTHQDVSPQIPDST